MNIKIYRLISLILISIFLNSCSSWSRNSRQGVSSSLVQYLYPEGEEPPKYEQNIPNLKLPLTVGLAFVPSASGNTRGLTEQHKATLLEKVRQRFLGRDFISNIVVIPDTYLHASKGFTGLEQISRLYGLDIVALVSYDQVTHVEENEASFLYWTIVGAYLIPASENEVQTFVDTAIFDVNTRKLLFRAPGVDKTSGVSTLIGVDRDTRKAEEQGFALAMDDMSKNLDAELQTFKQRIKTNKTVTVSHREGYHGGGAFDLSFLLLLLGLCFFQNRAKFAKN